MRRVLSFEIFFIFCLGIYYNSFTEILINCVVKVLEILNECCKARFKRQHYGLHLAICVGYLKVD